MKTKNRPDWWPENPYFESAMYRIQNDEDFVREVPDPTQRTAISWYLGNRFWAKAERLIWEALEEQKESQEEMEALEAAHTSVWISY